jgi:hypothetical protein
MLMQDRLTAALGLTRESFALTIDALTAGETATGGREDWNLRDTVCHVNEWIVFARRKVEAIAQGEVFGEAVDTAAFNRAAYEKHRTTSLPQARADNERALNELAMAVHPFSESDLVRRDFPIGFEMTLWQYVLLDGFIHPHKHLLYCCLKRGNAALFFGLCEKTAAVFDWYSPGNKCVYSFREFLSSDDECDRFFSRLNPQPDSAGQKTGKNLGIGAGD